MTIETVAALFVAAFVVKATPGPGVFATVGRALALGFRPTLVFIAGIMTGDFLYLACAFAGLAVIAHQWGELFFVVRLIGGGYLVWLGVTLWLRPPRPVDAAPLAPGRPGRAFLGGMVLTFGNPKVILLYLGLLPTFVDPDGLGGADMALLAAMFLAILGGTLTAYAFAAARARRLFTSAPAMKRLDRGAGALLVGTGGVVAAS